MGVFNLRALKSALMKDLEMTRTRWIEAQITSINLFISIVSGECVLYLKGHEFSSYGYFLVLGLVVGLIISYFLTDKIQHKMKFITGLFIVNFLTFQLAYFDCLGGSSAGIYVLVLARYVVWVLIIVNIAQVLNQTTGVLERGRIYAGLTVSCTVLLPLFAFGTTSLEFNFFYNMFNIVYFIIIAKLGSLKRLFFTSNPKASLKKSLDGDIGRYMVILALFGFSEGLLSPPVFSIVKGFDVRFAGPALLSVGLLVLGFVYDTYGRKQTLLIKSITFSTFAFFYFFDSMLFFSDFILRTYIALILVSIVSLFIILGDISSHTVKVFLITMLLLLLSAMSGMFLKEAIVAMPGLVLLPRFLGLFVLTINTIIISNTRDIFIKAEKQWYESMITLFVIHESGIMLFYKRFEGAKNHGDGLLGPDLISAGLVGISNFVCEILKGKRFISGIENYSSKILLEKGQKVIAALVVHQDMRILREKLKRFLNDFESNFKPISKELIAIDTEDIEVAEAIINGHFKGKRER